MTPSRLLIALFTSLLSYGYCAEAIAQPADPMPLAEVIQQIKHELSAAQSTAGSGVNLKLEKVDLTLTVSRTVDATGKVTIGVPSLYVEAGGSGNRKIEELSTLQVELAAPASAVTLSSEQAKGLGLTQMIVETRRQLAAGLSQTPVLEPQKVVMTVKFGVTKSGGATATLKLVIVSAGGAFTVTAANTHTAVLTFVKSKAP